MSSFTARTSYIKWDDDDVHFVLDQHAELDFYCASSLRQQTCCSTRTHYPDSELREEVANTNFIVFGFKSTICHTQRRPLHQRYVWILLLLIQLLFFLFSAI